MNVADEKIRALCDSRGITLHWHTCEDGWHSVDPAPKGKGTWVHMADAANLIERIAALEQQLERERKTYQTNVATMQQNEKVLIESHTRELAQARAENEQFEQNFAKRESYWIRENARLQAERDTLRAVLIEIGRDADCVLADNVSTEFLANLPNELRLQRERMGRPVTDDEWLELCAGTPVTSKVAECYMSRRELDEWIAARARQQERK